MAKWLDKYAMGGALPGATGMMYARNLSPFIPTKKNGGQMMQRGGTAYIDSVLNANKGLNWVQRLYEKNPQSIQIPGQKGTSTHFMESGDGRVYPTVVQMPNGQLQYLGDKARGYADSTKTYIQFPNDKQATRFGKTYKKGTGVLTGFKSGGAEHVDEYPMMQDPAPSNGKYAKKTKASAQKGKTITKREDFESWWNWASVEAAGGERRQQTHGNLGDLYAYYAGQPLKHNVLEHSQYKPTNAKDPKADYISINDSKFKQEVIDNYNRVFNEKKLLRDEKQLNDNTYAVSGYTRPRKEQIKKSKSEELYYEKGKDHVSNAIGHYYLSKGKDDKGNYISYYDVFDAGTGGSDGGGVGETLGLTKPFELYDRIYLDPKTGKPKMQNGGGLLSRTVTCSNCGWSWKAVDGGSDPLSCHKCGGTAKMEVGGQPCYECGGMYDQGGIIDDPMGQWAHPGEITRIPGSDITMQGVDYPVLGVSDTGDTQMMYPNQDYKFDGDKVTEFPIAQNGDWLSKYDNISNTNSLKKEAEERLSTMGKPKSTISQYTPKPGEQAKFDKQKLDRIAEDNAPLNRMAASKGAENMQDAIEAALIMEGGLAASKLIGKGAKAAGKYLTEKTALKDAYKLNPYAFKPTEGMMYRGIGKEGMEDALGSGVFRAKQDVQPIMKGNFDMSKQFSKPYFSPSFETADTYGNGFIAEVPKDATTWGNRYSNRNTWSQIAREDIPTEKGKILKKDWLKGYKEIPKKEDGGWLNKYK